MAGAAKDKKADKKQKALDTALTQIERSFGTGAIMRMGADSRLTAIEAIATGAINLDAAIGIGGMPRGRISEIYGPESSGKTTICLQVIANAQRSGGIAAFIDAEHALDVGYARKLGVDVDNLLVGFAFPVTQGCFELFFENFFFVSKRCRLFVLLS